MACRFPGAADVGIVKSGESPQLSVTVDREALRNFYLKNGYADFRVVSSVAEL